MMTRDETRQIREAALEDTALTQSARLLLSFIIDWHHKEKGCVMFDSTLAERLGMSERTIRRRRCELYQAGYLTEKQGANRRKLVPCRPDSAIQPPDTDVQTADTDDHTPDTSDRSPPDTDVQDREINNSEGTRESAPARGDSVEERYQRLVTLWTKASGTPPLQEKHERTFYRWADDGVIEDFDTYRQVLTREAESTAERGVNLSLSVLRDEYEREVESGVLSPERQKNPDWSVINGEPAFKGVPVSEIGMTCYQDEVDYSNR